MKIIKFFLAAIAGTMLLASCEREPSDSVDQDKIFTKYDIIYDKNEDKTYVRAEFRFSSALGTKLELSSPAQVKFNGEVMPFNSTWAYYEKQFTGLVSSGTFRYNDVDGNIFENTTGNIESVEFPATDITIQNGVDYSLAWVGDPIGANDGVTVTVDDKIFYTAITNATSITLGGAQSGDIAAGPYIATMFRTIATEPDEAPLEGGLIWLTHKAFNKAVTVQ